LAGIISAPNKVSDEQFKRNRKSWNDTYGGAGNTNKTAFLDGGQSYQSLGIKPIDAQFLEQRKFTLEEIARIYRVPLHLLQDLSRSTNNNIEHQTTDFAVHTIRPWLKRIEPEINRKFFTEAEKRDGKVRVKFNMDALLRGDVKSRSELYRTLFNTSSLSPNEIRQLEGFNPYAGGDIKYTQINMEPVGTDRNIE
jgi:HK97 family phage portal protein